MAVPPGPFLLLLLSLQVQCVTSKTTSVKPDDTTFSISTTTTPTEVLTNISSLTVVNVTKSTISIQWEAAPCSCRYRIEYRIVSNSWNNISNTMNKTYLLENLEADQDYNITVFNENSTQDGTQLSLINNTAPSGLESLSVRAVNTSFVNVTWKYVTSPNMDGKTYITLDAEISKSMYSSNTTNLNMTMTVLNISSIPGTEVTFYASLKRKTWPGSVMTASGHTQPAKPRLRVSKTKTNMLEMNVTVDGIFTNYTIEVVGLSDKVFINSTNVTGLESGRNYILTAYSSIGNEISEKANVTATTVPADIDGITLDRSRSNKTTLTAKWVYVKSRDTFEVNSTLLNNGTLQTQLSKNTNDTSIILTGLIPGGKYNVCVIAKTSNLSSNPVCNQTVLCPSLPQNLKARSTSTTSITLTWTHDDTSIIRGWIIYYANVSVNISEGTINYTFKNLTSGTKYNFRVEPFTDDGVKCDNETRMATVKPTCLLKLEEKNTTNVSVVLTANSSNSEYDNYIFHFASHQGSENFTTLTNETLRFTDRLPGTTYTISVRTVKDSENSDICTERINITTNPNRAEVANVVLMSQNISLLLKSPNSTLIDLYFVSYFVENENKTVNTTNSSVLLAPLEPYTNYSITFWVQTNGKNSEKTVGVYATKQDAPAAVRDIVCSKIGSHSLRVTWSAPAKANGEILNYVVSHYKIMKNDSSKKNETDLSSNLTNLSPGSNYHISVTALTVRYGVENTTVCYLNTSAPSYRNGYVAVNSTPTKGDFISPHSFSITLYPAFSDDHGEIIKYFVIVTTNSNDKPNENVSVWSHTNRQKTYRAAVLDKNFFWSSKRSTDKKLEEKKFTIGVDTNCKETQPCNGPLEPATGYHVKFRAINKDSYADTEYSKKIWTLESPKSVPTTVIAVVVVVVLAMAVILVALALLLYRRRKKSELLESISSRTCILKPSSHPVKLSEFKNHVALMASDSDFRFAEEYEDLKEVGRDQSCTAAELPENRSKNRFTNILPYDHSRVKLVPADDDDGSDYINANYIPGYNFKREYIATQGPLRSTRDDFWRMVWEQNSRNIVMLTRCLEKHKEKCDHYWPENGEPMFYGDLQVSTLNETIFPDWVITEFNISLGEQSKQLRHFHYTAWPDFGVPENPQSLIRFVKTVREKLFSDMGPIIVHCSAGVGRSGTFIGLDSMLHYIDNGNETVDVLGVVHEMRKHRCYMVQTEQQYICLHDCILCVLEGNDDDMVYENFEQDQPRDNVCQGQDNKAYEDDEGINLEMA